MELDDEDELDDDELDDVEPEAGAEAAADVVDAGVEVVEDSDLGEAVDFDLEAALLSVR